MITSENRPEALETAEAPTEESDPVDVVAPAEESVVEESTPAEAEESEAEESTPAEAEKSVVEESTPAEAEESVVEESTPAEAEESSVAEEEPVPEELPGKWYAVHTYSGYEKRACLALLERAKTAGLTDKLIDVLVPEEEVVEVKKGERVTSTRKLFPGYILVRMVLDSQSWHLVKGTPKVTGFIGGDPRNPTPVPDSEVNAVNNKIEEGKKAPTPIQRFESGDSVRVIDGPFQNFNGTVEDVNYDKAKLRVLVSIFGRATPIELDFVQVESTG
jgi:transcriptional antiterminator NusG